MQGPWKSLIKPDDIDVVSPDGEIRSRVKGYYSGTQFVIDDMSVDIRVGDEIRRRLPNGNEEAFSVEDQKFYDGHFGKHYQVIISRRGSFPPHTGGNYRINVSGTNARVTIGGADSSINTVNNHALFDDMRLAVSKGVSEQAMLADLRAQVSALEAANTQPRFLQAYQKFIALAADHTTILTPFLPALTAIIPTLPHS